VKRKKGRKRRKANRRREVLNYDRKPMACEKCGKIGEPLTYYHGKIICFRCRDEEKERERSVK